MHLWKFWIHWRGDDEGWSLCEPGGAIVISSASHERCTPQQIRCSEDKGGFGDHEKTCRSWLCYSTIQGMENVVLPQVEWHRSVSSPRVQTDAPLNPTPFGNVLCLHAELMTYKMISSNSAHISYICRWNRLEYYLQISLAHLQAEHCLKIEDFICR